MIKTSPLNHFILCKLKAIIGEVRDAGWSGDGSNPGELNVEDLKVFVTSKCCLIVFQNVFLNVFNQKMEFSGDSQKTTRN